MRRAILMPAVVMAFFGGCAGPVVPEGIYRGTVTSITRMYQNGLLLYQEVGSMTTVAPVGPSGLPLTDDNQPMYVGYTKSQTVGGMEMQLTVTGIQSLNDGFIIEYDVGILYTAGEDELLMTGWAHDVVTVTDTSALDYTGQMYVAHTFDDGTTLAMSIDFAGQLNP